MGLLDWLFPSRNRSRNTVLPVYRNGRPHKRGLKEGETYTLAQLDGDSSNQLKLHVMPAARRPADMNEWLKSAVNVTSALTSLGPSVAVAAQAGQMLQVVGRPELLQGLANGTMQLMNNPHGATLVVRHIASGQFAGHLNVGTMGAVGAAKIAGPLILFQAMSIVTGQYFFNRLDRQLRDIQGQLDRVETHQRFTSISKLIAFRREAERIASEIRRTLPASDLRLGVESAILYGDLGARISRLVVEVDVELEHSLLWINRFERAVENVVELDKQGKSFDTPLRNIKGDLERYEESFALAGSWFDLAAALHEIGRVYDARINPERLSLRDEWRAEYMLRAETLGDSTSFEQLTAVAKKRKEDFEGALWSYKRWKGWIKREAKATARSLCATLDTRVGADGEAERLPEANVIDLIQVDGQTYAVASTVKGSD